MKKGMSMKILLIGCTGVIGKAVYDELSQDHEIFSASLSDHALPIDIGSSESIAKLYKKVGKVDAVVCCAARGVIFSELKKMAKEDYLESLQQKTLGQIDLVLQGLSWINQGGSFTLTTGNLNREPIATGSAASMVNHALEGFVKAAAMECSDLCRINVVSPDLVEESKQRYASLFPGYLTVPVAHVAKFYRKSIEGMASGQIYVVDK